jgi:hypothetical protein
MGDTGDDIGVDGDSDRDRDFEHVFRRWESGRRDFVGDGDIGGGFSRVFSDNGCVDHLGLGGDGSGLPLPTESTGTAAVRGEFGCLITWIRQDCPFASLSEFDESRFAEVPGAIIRNAVNVYCVYPERLAALAVG